MRLVQRREWDETLESLEGRGIDPNRSRVLQTAVDDPVADADQSVARELALQEVVQILDRAIVAELPPGPGLLGNDAARRILGHEARRRVEALDLPPHLERELAGTLGEDGELEARRASVENEDRIVRSRGNRHTSTMSSISGDPTRQSGCHPSRNARDLVNRPATTHPGDARVVIEATVPTFRC